MDIRGELGVEQHASCFNIFGGATSRIVCAQLMFGCAATSSGEVPKELQGLVTAAYYAWLVRHSLLPPTAGLPRGVCVPSSHACCSYA
jgi:hypothetical protein